MRIIKLLVRLSSSLSLQGYNELTSDVTNQIKEFQTHYKLDDIINEINLVDGSGKQLGVRYGMTQYDNSQKDTLNETAKRFVNSLEQNSNDYIDEELS
jgi:hypothetical protein